jgi:DNA modification methylase
VTAGLFALPADRKAFLMELDPSYCHVIAERWQKFTGKTAERISATQEASV